MCIRDRAADAGYRKFIMFLHYPPTNILEETSPFTEIAEEYGVSAVVYSHCHGAVSYTHLNPPSTWTSPPSRTNSWTSSLQELSSWTLAADPVVIPDIFLTGAIASKL